MRLTKLELHGFKSFADNTVMKYDDGVTAIVGPNGCGKSNVSDAVRWVLGEQRARLLRGQKMEEVIFQGSTARRPVNIAEVSLHFDNSDGELPVAFREVVVTRRLSRSGESEYLLNRAPCRLRDISDLLRGTGLGADTGVVIESKMIDALLSDRPDDRRELFEEAAGSASIATGVVPPSGASRRPRATSSASTISSLKYRARCVRCPGSGSAPSDIRNSPAAASPSKSPSRLVRCPAGAMSLPGWRHASPNCGR
ncbi:MAG TPA: AAA family ATPase [Gemmatimonadaceae bacterium]|nr:AAA family ATPase [Gemmatimonadaceae bacterium]